MIILTILSCLDEKNSIDSYNSGKKLERFTNTNLLFRGMLDEWNCKILFNRIQDNCNNIYRKSVYEFLGDSCEYYMYGISKNDSLALELRIRSFCNGSFVSDYLIIDFEKRNGIFFDYSFNSNVMVLCSAKDGWTHHSYYKFINGNIINETLIPDTIFNKQNQIPDAGRRVRIFNDFELNKMNYDGVIFELTGIITKLFRGKGYIDNMIIRLDTARFLNSRYIQTGMVVNSETTMSRVKSDSLVILKNYDLKQCVWPIYEPEFLLSDVVVEYY